MGFPYLMLLAVGLSMDAFAVAVACGCGMGRARPSEALRIGLFFGGFQALMPALGWLAGLGFRDTISSADHWIAFSLLALIGVRMIIESFRSGGEVCEVRRLSLRELLALSVATSIDALAVGVSLSLLDVWIVYPATVIGLTTFSISFAGVYLGCGVGKYLRRGAEVLGGVVLVGIGARILVQHIGG